MPGKNNEIKKLFKNREKSWSQKLVFWDQWYFSRKKRKNKLPISQMREVPTLQIMPIVYYFDYNWLIEAQVDQWKIT